MYLIVCNNVYVCVYKCLIIPCGHSQKTFDEVPVAGNQRACSVVGYNNIYIYVCPKATTILKGQKRDQIKSDNAYRIPMNRKQMQKRVSISVHPTRM